MFLKEGDIFRHPTPDTRHPKKEKPMSKPWFDPKTGMLLFDQYVQEMPSFKKVMEDEVVTNEEFRAQAEKVSGLLQQLERMLDNDTKTVCTAALCELAVLNALLLKRAQTSV
jgi:hypothetical protein